MKNADYLEHMTEDDIAMAKRQGYDPTADPSYFIGYQHGRAAGMREAHALIMASKGNLEL